MNTTSALSESSKDLHGLSGADAALDEAWFDAAPPSVRRSSAPPPSSAMRVGEFLGDPLADSWLR